MRTSAPGAVLEVRNVNRSFGGVRAVHDVSLRLTRDKLTVLIGPNGAGKTTIFNLITGALRPSSGSVLLDGEDLTRTAAHRRAQLGIARTFQDVRLFDGMSVAENIEVYAQSSEAVSILKPFVRPLRSRRSDRVARSRAAEIMEQLGISRLARYAVEDLSYAQQKLVAIARLIAGESRVLLLDEPASGLDEAGREHLCSVVRSLSAQGLTVCVVEHNLDVVRNLADELVFLADGRVLAKGAPSEIFASSELAEIYFGSGVNQ